MNIKEIISWLLVALILAFFISPFASSSPDGLERVAEDKGFLEKEEIDSHCLATGLAGIFGTLVVFGIAYGIGAIIKR